MKEINENDAARLATMIYKPNIQKVFKDTTRQPDGNYKMSDLVITIEDDLSKTYYEYFGAELTEEEYLEVIDQIKSSETLMSLEIENYVNDEKTNFRAMTIVDPKEETKPIIVFRGTAGDYQWDDNFAAMISSLTPAQQAAQQYIANSGYDHLTVSGHSKGGSMSGAMAYLLPDGMVDKVYSFDGQGVSDIFLSNISDKKIESAKPWSII